MILFPTLNLETSITLELGILAIFTIFFSFAGIKSNIQNEFRQTTIQFLDKYKLTKKVLDFVTSTMDKKYKIVTNLLREMGRTFRFCIYIGLPIIIVLIINEELKLLWLEIIILLAIVTQIWGIFLNVHRFKTFYELDLEEELNEQKTLLDVINIMPTLTDSIIASTNETGVPLTEATKTLLHMTPFLFLFSAIGISIFSVIGLLRKE